MKTNVIIVCLALIFSGSQVFAQLSKAEKKEWKKKAKQYGKNPATLKEMTEAKQTADNQVTKLTGGDSSGWVRRYFSNWSIFSRFLSLNRPFFLWVSTSNSSGITPLK